MKKESNILLYIFTALYLIVHFIPDFEGADVMGAQWLYTSIVDLLVLSYITFNYNQYKEAIAGIFNIKFTLVYAAFLLWALASYYYAINPTEALVCLARLVSTFLIFMNLSILFYKKELSQTYFVIACILTFILIFDALFVINQFKIIVSDTESKLGVASIVGNNGNKNVMAASLLIKFPFALYLIRHTKIAGKFIGVASIFLGTFALFILSTRSTFVGLLLIFIIFSITTIYFSNKNNKKAIVTNILLFLIPIVVAYFSANLVFGLIDNSSEGSLVDGAVTSRIKSIQITNEGSSGRLNLWKAAIDYATKHPFIGDGYGNWKLASIPYEKERANDLFVPYHAHNDYLETFADLGIIGGVLYIALFVLVGLFSLKIWRDEKSKQYHFMATISLMAIVCYFVDAMLNFPTERTSMQTMLTVSAFLVFAPYSLIQINEKVKQSDVNKDGDKTWIPFYIVFSFILIGSSIFINKQVYQSLKVQKYVMGEIDADPKMALDDVKDAFPHFPNLSTSTLPIKALVARYYYRDKMYDESLRLLRSCEKDNPYLHYTDFIKTAVFASLGNYDSVSYYSKKAFYNWPRATSYYKNVIFSASRQKDTAEINKAFATYIKYRNEPEGWNQYLLGRFELMGASNALSLKILDSAIKLFPKDTTTFTKIRGLFAANGAAVAPASNDYITKGVQAFQKGQYSVAAQQYLLASQADPANYTNFENIGICYYSARQFEKAIPYFEKAAQFAQATTGKSEFYKAMCFISVGKKNQACNALQIAKQKNYPNTDQFITSNCK